MAEERPLGELIREFVSSLGEYISQKAAGAINKALSEPLKRAARKVLLLGLAFGLAFMAAIMLALAFFNVLVELFGTKSLAYAVTFLICLMVGALCAWAVLKDAKQPGRRGKSSDGTGSVPATDADKSQDDGEHPPAGPAQDAE